MKGAGSIVLREVVSGIRMSNANTALIAQYTIVGFSFLDLCGLLPLEPLSSWLYSSIVFAKQRSELQDGDHSRSSNWMSSHWRTSIATIRVPWRWRVTMGKREEQGRRWSLSVLLWRHPHDWIWECRCERASLTWKNDEKGEKLWEWHALFQARHFGTV